MNNLNSILVEGELPTDPEVTYTEKGTCICQFTLRSVRYSTQAEGAKKEVSLFRVRTWGKLAEVCGEYLKKGRGVRVVGRLKSEEDGTVIIIAEHVEFKPQVMKSVPTETLKEVNERRGA